MIPQHRQKKGASLCSLKEIGREQLMLFQLDRLMEFRRAIYFALEIHTFHELRCFSAIVVEPAQHGSGDDLVQRDKRFFKLTIPKNTSNRTFPSLELLIDVLCQVLDTLADDAERLRALTSFPHLRVTI